VKVCVAQYVAQMKLLAATCDFGENLEEMLRDRFIQGISNSETQHKLLTDPELTFQRAVEIAKGQEAATKEVVRMGNGSAISVNKIHSNSPLKLTSDAFLSFGTGYMHAQSMWKALRYTHQKTMQNKSKQITSAEKLWNHCAVDEPKERQYR